MNCQELAIALLTIAGVLLVVCIVGIWAIFRNWGWATEIRKISAEKERLAHELNRANWEIDAFKNRTRNV